MREILFRGKRIADGKWVYGDYCHPDALDEDGYEEHIIIERPADGSEYYVIPETVGQFTGLKDRNGNKIFEGDIVRRSDGSICYVGYVAGVYRFFEKANRFNEAIYNYYSYVEVIGNIHDNPELLAATKAEGYSS